MTLIHYDTKKKTIKTTDDMNLQIENLSFRYGRRKPYVLEDVNLNFSEGGVTGLLGPNGAGKSTLLYLISGVLRASGGEVRYDGMNTCRRLPQTLSQIYLVAEEAGLPRMSLEKFVDLNSVFYPNFDRGVMATALKEFDMFEPKRLDALSMGQKKKILLSFAFACNTPVVLLDEPTNGLDIPGKAAFRRLVAMLASDERLFLISTHQVRDLDNILDRVLIMNERRFLLNESFGRLTETFSFPRGERTAPADAIYTLPSPGGVDSMLLNEYGEDTDVNLEILFEATLKFPDRIREALSSKGEKTDKRTIG